MLKKWMLQLIQKYFLKVDTKILPGDLICPVNNEELIYEAVDIYYTRNLKPILFFKQCNGAQVFSANVFEYKRAPIVLNADFPVF